MCPPWPDINRVDLFKRYQGCLGMIRTPIPVSLNEQSFGSWLNTASPDMAEPRALLGELPSPRGRPREGLINALWQLGKQSPRPPSDQLPSDGDKWFHPDGGAGADAGRGEEALGVLRSPARPLSAHRLPGKLGLRSKCSAGLIRINRFGAAFAAVPFYPRPCCRVRKHLLI